MLLRKQLLPVPPRSHCSPMQPHCLGLDSAPRETRGRCSAGMGVCMAAHRGALWLPRLWEGDLSTKWLWGKWESCAGWSGAGWAPQAEGWVLGGCSSRTTAGCWGLLCGSAGRWNSWLCTPLVPGLGLSWMDAPGVCVSACNGTDGPHCGVHRLCCAPLTAVQGRPQLWKSGSKAGNCPSPTGEFLPGTWAKQTGDFPFPLLHSLSPEVTRLLQGNPPSLSPC